MKSSTLGCLCCVLPSCIVKEPVNNQTHGWKQQALTTAETNTFAMNQDSNYIPSHLILSILFILFNPVWPIKLPSIESNRFLPFHVFHPRPRSMETSKCPPSTSWVPSPSVPTNFSTCPPQPNKIVDKWEATWDFFHWSSFTLTVIDPLVTLSHMCKHQDPLSVQKTFR